MRSRSSRHVTVTVTLALLITAAALGGTNSVLASEAGLPFGASVACGCEGGVLEKVVKQNGKVVPECVFSKAKEECTIAIEDRGATEFEIKNSELKGFNPGNYKETLVGCVAGTKKFKKPEKCVDALEVATFQEESVNEFCVNFKPEPAGTTIPICTKLVM